MHPRLEREAPTAVHLAAAADPHVVAPGVLGPVRRSDRARGGRVVVLLYSRNGMSIFVWLLYSVYVLGKVLARFRSSTIPQ
jgi:hypothetical protein